MVGEPEIGRNRADVGIAIVNQAPTELDVVMNTTSAEAVVADDVGLRGASVTPETSDDAARSVGTNRSDRGFHKSSARVESVTDGVAMKKKIRRDQVGRTSRKETSWKRKARGRELS